ncbi:uncharacterized protein LOC121810431 [Salvia splendens]|nr:uncharacterized protein LOC121810431 [Salvia splendens]
MRVVYLMLRKGITKGKLLAHLNMMMKRGKIASKAAIHNLMFHHHHHRFRLPFHLTKRRSSHAVFDRDTMAASVESFSSAVASPALPGFGPSPLVRQLRITDSPFPLTDAEAEEDNNVDEAAEEFITKFYDDLKRQNSNMFLEYY